MLVVEGFQKFAVIPFGMSRIFKALYHNRYALIAAEIARFRLK
jgi:hypothetical protein